MVFIYRDQSVEEFESLGMTADEINSICKKYGIKNYTINTDGTIDVDGDVHLSENGLTKLPLKFGKVTGDFFCAFNQLNSLEGSPHWVGIDFNCNDNNLKSLEGGPEIVIGCYYCNSNNLVNFKGFPEDYDGYSDFYGNPVYKLFGKKIP